MPFELHPRLAADSHHITDFALCEVRLINDANYPWIVLIPRRDAIREIHELVDADQRLFLEELSSTSKRMQALFSADKMNVAALGNMVPQLHLHIVARFADDPAWPGAIWGATDTQPYTAQARAERIERIAAALTPAPGARDS